MTHKINLTHFGLISFILVSLISCGTGFDYNEISPEDEKSFQDYVLTSYYLLKDREEPEALGLSRATFPAHTHPDYTFVDLAGTTLIPDYPEKGQDTLFTSSGDLGGGLYRITAFTTYHPEWETEIESFTETYYIRDLAPIGTLDTADVITDAAGIADPFYREKFEAKYADGSTRYYQLVAAIPSDNSGYDSFDIEGSLTFPSGSWVPPADSSALWSSKVIYAQYFNKSWIFWRKNNKILVGARYYTEHGDDPLNPTKTSVSYERMVYLNEDVETNLKNNARESVSEYIDYLFNDGDTPALLNSLTLAETVIRYQITPGTPDDNKIIRQRTEVVNKFGEDFVFQAGTDINAADPGNSVPVSF